MAISFLCPECGKRVDISRELAGQTGPCPHCQGRIVVPGPREAAEPATGAPFADRRDREPSPQALLALSLTCVSLFAAADFLIAPLMAVCSPRDPMAVCVYMCVGAIGAQGGLHAIWFVLAPVGFTRRLAVGVYAGLFLFAAWALGYAVSVVFDLGYYGYLRHDFWGPIGTGLLCLPLLAIAIQAPLWLARLSFGWRILHRADPARRSSAEAFGIRDILLATAAVALALSAVRLAAPESVSAQNRLMSGLALAALAAAGISLFTTLPVVVATLRARRVWLGLLAVLLVDVAIFLGVITTVAAIARSPLPPGMVVDLLFVLSMVGSFFVCLAGVLLMVRRLGYRLFWRVPRGKLAGDTDGQ